tara:strand:- start:321 stop:449 length:129 start_codon:yes stop_codon:yes gene_type:complete
MANKEEIKQLHNTSEYNGIYDIIQAKKRDKCNEQQQKLDQYI